VVVASSAPRFISRWFCPANWARDITH
jgi:hypothetical protein